MSQAGPVTTRPSSIAELREVTQPPEVRGRRNAEHWTASLYLRRFSPYLTWLLLKTSISANGVTGLMILVGWSTAAALLIPGIWGALLAVVLGQLEMLVDCCDGAVARWRRTSSPAGVFLDKVGHYTTEKGEKKESLLLASGWWGIARHFHYVPEILGALFWTLPALFSDVLPYFYVVFLTALLTDRAFRDDNRCAIKYGEDWKAYCRKVPYKILPGIV